MEYVFNYVQHNVYIVNRMLGGIAMVQRPTAIIVEEHATLPALPEDPAHQLAVMTECVFVTQRRSPSTQHNIESCAVAGDNHVQVIVGNDAIDPVVEAFFQFLQVRVESGPGDIL